MFIISSGSATEPEKEKSPTSDVEVVTLKQDNENGKSGSSGEEETSGDSGWFCDHLASTVTIFNVFCLTWGQVIFRKRPAPQNGVKYLRPAPVPKRTSLMTFLTVPSRLAQISSVILRREIASLNDGVCTKGAVIVLSCFSRTAS